MISHTYSADFFDALSAYSAAATITRENHTAHCTVVQRGWCWSVIVSYEDAL